MVAIEQDLTYSQLLLDLQSYMERTDAAFNDKRARFIMLGENRLATLMKQQGFQAVVEGVLPQENSMAKPAFWRETISFSITVNGADVPVYLRSLEYLKAYAPDATPGQPKFYGDYNISNFRLAPVPDAAYPFQLVYYARLEPLSVERQSNWMTLNTPQALLYACLLEAALWVKNAEKIQQWQTQFDQATSALLAENMERIADRNTVLTRP